MEAKYRALTIAKWFIAWAEAEDAELSNLKLQKLLYYSQGYHLARFGFPLFSDRIEAWAHGPVVADVYHAYKCFRSDDIHLPDSDTFAWDDVDEQATDLLLQVWNTYGPVAAWKLRNMTHRERPWIEAFAQDSRNEVIGHSSLERYFSDLIAAKTARG